MGLVVKNVPVFDKKKYFHDRFDIKLNHIYMGFNLKFVRKN